MIMDIEKKSFASYLLQILSHIRNDLYCQTKIDVISYLDENDKVLRKLKQDLNNCYDLYESQTKIIFGTLKVSLSDKNNNLTLIETLKYQYDCKQKYDDYISAYLKSNPIQVDEDKVLEKFRDAYALDEGVFRDHMRSITNLL